MSSISQMNYEALYMYIQVGQIINNFGPFYINMLIQHPQIIVYHFSYDTYSDECGFNHIAF